MLIARVYSVMDRLVVEVSCVHQGDPAGSHLVVREERSGLPISQDGALRALCDVSDVAASLIRSQRAGGYGAGLEDCESGWVSPSG